VVKINSPVAKCSASRSVSLTPVMVARPDCPGHYSTISIGIT
jgi:hypothetical protein